MAGSTFASAALVGAMAVAGVSTTPAVAAIRSGATYVAQVDAQPPPGEPWSFLRIFPAVLHVHQGDVIDASWAGTDTPHTGTLVPDADAEHWRQVNQGPGGPYQPIGPDQQFGGDDNGLVLNPALVFPTDPTCGGAGNPCPWDGASVVSSGLNFPNPQAQPQFFAQVNAPVGSYSFLCLLHPGMEISLQVVPKGQRIKSPAQVTSQVAKQVARASLVDGRAADAQAQEVQATPIGKGKIDWSINAGGFSNNVSANELLGAGLSIHAGDHLTVVGTGEIHTVTSPFGSYQRIPFTKTVCEVPGKDPPAQSPLDCQDPSEFRVDLSNKAINPTQFHGLDGDRFVNAGLLPDPSASYTFVAKTPGTYQFVCLVHGPEMTTTITVEP